MDHNLAPRGADLPPPRDRDATAAHTELMRPGMGKVFKQILDAQARAAKEPPSKRRRRRRKPG
jgi:hypothetical protein